MPHRVHLRYSIGGKSDLLHFNSEDEYSQREYLSADECSQVTRLLDTPYWCYSTTTKDVQRTPPQEAAAYQAAARQGAYEASTRQQQLQQQQELVNRITEEDDKRELVQRRNVVLMDIDAAIEYARKQREASKGTDAGRNYSLAITKLEEAKHWVQAIRF